MVIGVLAGRRSVSEPSGVVLHLHLGELREDIGHAAGQAHFAFIDQQHRGDASDRLGHRIDAEQAVGRITVEHLASRCRARHIRERPARPSAAIMPGNLPGPTQHRSGRDQRDQFRARFGSGIGSHAAAMPAQPASAQPAVIRQASARNGHGIHPGIPCSLARNRQPRRFREHGGQSGLFHARRRPPFSVAAADYPNLPRRKE
jgi:hypothetical protein